MTERVPECLTCRHWYRYRERIVGECTISPRPLSHRYRGQFEIREPAGRLRRPAEWIEMYDKKYCASCSYFEMDLGKPHGQWYTCSLHKEYIEDDSQAEKCEDYWKIFTPKPERKEARQ